MTLVQAKVETVRRGDLLRLPNSGRLVPCSAIEETLDGTEIRLSWRVNERDQGSFAPLRRGERWPIERRTPTMGGDGQAAPADAPPASRPARDLAAAAPSPISNARARTLATILCGYRWPGGMPPAGSRRARAAEQVARSALESLAVVE